MKSTYKTGEVCEKDGYYTQIETGERIWHEKGDKFSPYHRPTGEVLNDFSVTEEHSASYVYFGPTNK